MPKYTEDQWKKLTISNSVDVAKALGLEIDEKGSDRKAFHIKNHGGLFVWKNGSGFYHSSENAKGNSVNLVEHILGCSYREALDFINDNVMNGSFTPTETKEYSSPEPDQNKSLFQIPKRDPSAKRAYAYLIQTRNIDPDIVKEMVEKGSISQEAEHGNVCFIGFDKTGEPKYCALRGTITDKPFKGEVPGSDKSYGFCINGTSRQLVVFESAIDALSYATLEKIGKKDSWKLDTKLSLGGCAIKALEQHLKDYPNCYDTIKVAVDNDEAGHKFAEVVKTTFGGDYVVTRHCPAAKDFNEDLCNVTNIYKSSLSKALATSLRSAVVSYYAQSDEVSLDSENEEMVM